VVRWTVALGAFAFLGAGFAVAKLFDFKASGGSLSPYLVGFYDLNPGFSVEPISARLYLVNPTPVPLVAYVAFFDDEEKPLACTKPTLSPNGLKIVDVDEFVNSTNNPHAQGVIKIVTFAASQPGVKVQAGIKGWLRHHAFKVVQVVPVNQTANQTGSVNQTIRQPLVESELREVPAAVLMHDVSAPPGQGDDDERGQSADGDRKARRPTELELIVGVCS